ncbi:MAG: hypothetical protein SFH39_17665 [Candidatus Magnetobacterium sp. LHC-1]|nr:hypothetical protein [Nitrospirota bacterium]
MVEGKFETIVIVHPPKKKERKGRLRFLALQDAPGPLQNPLQGGQPPTKPGVADPLTPSYLVDIGLIIHNISIVWLNYYKQFSYKENILPPLKIYASVSMRYGKISPY